MKRYHLDFVLHLPIGSKRRHLFDLIYKFFFFVRAYNLIINLEVAEQMSAKLVKSEDIISFSPYSCAGNVVIRQFNSFSFFNQLP
jgi:hypothetical protein